MKLQHTLGLWLPWMDWKSTIASPDFCFVQCQIKPSMTPGMYKVALLLKKEAWELHQLPMLHVNVRQGKLFLLLVVSAILFSLLAGCLLAVFVSGLLHVLVAMNLNSSAAGPADIGGDEEEAVPVTSRLCEWK